MGSGLAMGRDERGTERSYPRRGPRSMGGCGRWAGPGPARSTVAHAIAFAAAIGEETDTLEEIYERYSRSIYSLSLRILREAALSEDVVQEVFLRLWRQPTAYDAARGTLSSWLMSVAHHRSIDMLRRRKTRAEQSLPEDWASDHIIENGALDPADIAGQQDEAIAIRRAR